MGVQEFVDASNVFNPLMHSTLPEIVVWTEFYFWQKILDVLKHI